MWHLAATVVVDHTDTWIQSVIGPIAIIVVGGFLNRFNKKRSEKLEDKLTKQVSRVQSDLSTKVVEAKKEITNEHPQHLRDDLDERFSNLDSKFVLVLNKQDLQNVKLDALRKLQTKHGAILTSQAGVIVGLRRDLGELYGDTATAKKDISDLQDALERTTPKSNLPEIEP